MNIPKYNFKPSFASFSWRNRRWKMAFVACLAYLKISSLEIPQESDISLPIQRLFCDLRLPIS